jgi:hypothetical protein
MNLKKKALKLLDQKFLFRANQKIGELGVVGEERNRLAVFVGCVSRMTEEPVSLMGKGSTGSGKSKQFKTGLQLFPPSCVIERAGLSGKALAYGKGSLGGKILFINEYRCGQDAQQLLRLLQSDREVRHEATTIKGSHRTTDTAVRSGTPVVLTTTTDDVVYPDDESRFQSLFANEGPDQSRKILIAKASAPSIITHDDLPVWQKATSLLKPRPGDFRHPPEWLRFVAGQIPCGDVRVRRDWSRFLTFCQAVALCRRPTMRSNQSSDITFPDYCVAYKIFEPIFASVVHGLPSREVELSRAVATLNRQRGRPVSLTEVATELGWKRSLAYKHAARAVRHRLVEYELGTRESNIKRLIARSDTDEGFLPRPRLVFDHNPEIGLEARYVDPFTGKTLVMRRRNSRSPHEGKHERRGTAATVGQKLSRDRKSHAI